MPESSEGESAPQSPVDESAPTLVPSASATENLPKETAPVPNAPVPTRSRRASDEKDPREGPSTPIWNVWVDEQDKSLRQDTDKDGFLSHVEKTGSVMTSAELKVLLKELYSRECELAVKTNVRVFREGVMPLWEDPANMHGGRWVMTFTRKQEGLQKLVKVLGHVVDGKLSMNKHVTGIVLSTRRWGHLLSMWCRRVPSKAQNKEGEKELKGLLEPRNAAFYLHKDLRDTHFNKWRKGSDKAGADGGDGSRGASPSRAAEGKTDGKTELKVDGKAGGSQKGKEGGKQKRSSLGNEATPRQDQGASIASAVSAQLEKKTRSNRGGRKNLPQLQTDAASLQPVSQPVSANSTPLDKAKVQLPTSAHSSTTKALSAELNEGMAADTAAPAMPNSRADAPVLQHAGKMYQMTPEPVVEGLLVQGLLSGDGFTKPVKPSELSSEGKADEPRKLPPRAPDLENVKEGENEGLVSPYSPQTGGSFQPKKPTPEEVPQLQTIVSGQILPDSPAAEKKDEQ